MRAATVGSGLGPLVQRVMHGGRVEAVMNRPGLQAGPAQQSQLSAQAQPIAEQIGVCSSLGCL